MLIAVPMMFIMVNRLGGYLIVNIAVPALYSAIFVLGAYLYSISLLALLVTFCIAIAVVGYWTFIYHSASTAYARRKEKLKRVCDSGFYVTASRRRRSATSMVSMKSTASHHESLSMYTKRVMGIMRHSLQHGITLLSVRNTQHVKKMAQQHLWCSMNKHRPLLSTLLSQGCERKVQKRGSFGVADDVSSIMSTTDKYRPYFHSSRRGSLLSIFNSDDSDVEDDESELVVVALSKAEESMRRLTPTIIFEPKDIYTQVRSRLLSPDECEDASPSCPEVTEGDLNEEFKKVLHAYYPNGLALSSAEREEAYDLYLDWKLSIDHQFFVRLVDPPINEVRTIPLSLFEEWLVDDFSYTFKNNITDRLIDNTLRLVPRRKKRYQHAQLNSPYRSRSRTGIPDRTSSGRISNGVIQQRQAVLFGPRAYL